jgi:DNA repair protein RecO (recombination protein O)
LVLREQPIGENDKLLTVLTAEYGSIRMSAKGVRSMKSRMMPLCRMFTYGNFEFYEKHGMRWLSGGSVNDSFFGLHADIEGFALAAYLLEVATEISGEGVDGSEVLRMTLNSLYLIEKQKKPRELIKGVYETFAAVYSGFAPDLGGCGSCEVETADRMYLDVMNGALLCPACFARGGDRGMVHAEEAAATRSVILPVSPTVRAALQYVAGAELGKRFAFDISDSEELRSFSQVSGTYLQHHLERGFDTLHFYESVKEDKHEADHQ